VIKSEYHIGGEIYKIWAFKYIVITRKRVTRPNTSTWAPSSDLDISWFPNPHSIMGPQGQPKQGEQNMNKPDDTQQATMKSAAQKEVQQPSTTQDLAQSKTTTDEGAYQQGVLQRMEILNMLQSGKPQQDTHHHEMTEMSTPRTAIPPPRATQC